jgi:hypothetical protein
MTIIDRIDGDIVSSSTKEAAFAWAERGVRVLALHGVTAGECDCGDRQCQSPGKHPIGKEFPNGHKSATADRAKIRRVFTKYPNANLAIVPPSGHLVVDVDGEVGKDSFEKLGLPETAYQLTGRGRHYHFGLEGSWPDRPPKLAGIDFKTENGYVVVAPSTHLTDKKYRWSRRLRRIATVVAKDLFRKTSKPVDFSGEKLSVRSGSRNNMLTSFAGYLRFRGLSGDHLYRVLCTMNAEICSPPLDDDEVRKIAGSIDGYVSGADEAFMSLADVEEEEVQFLIYPYLVKGAANVLDGNMGEGKSTFTAAIASAVTTGKRPLSCQRSNKATFSSFQQKMTLRVP